MTVREITEKNEHFILAEDACFADSCKGRRQKISPCDVRTEFQRDRDRILHSKSFRRLKHKTQVFIIPEGDHYRTRLTHTLEVSQIARTIGRALRLNEDLIEAIALGHDLGHTPFGHAGERALARICPYGFEHNKHSLRVVDFLENGTGLNLTYEVRDGILNHRSALMPETLEGLTVRFADKIAYINHDIDDAQRGGIISADEIPKNCIDILGKTHGERINTMVLDMINTRLSPSPKIQEATSELREFLFKNVYIGSRAKTEESKGERIIASLYEYFTTHPEALPGNEQKALKNADIHRIVCDYIAGMSDEYAIEIFKKIFLPTPWKIK